MASRIWSSHFSRNHSKYQIFAFRFESAEILSVEITLEKEKKATICCIYRAPNTNLDMLSDFMYNTIFRNKRNKTIYVCGHFNVDLLQYDKHRDTNNFIDQLYSLGLHPLITRPTRITSRSNTLIDNIYTTDITSCIQSGLIINDMTDHLPIFQITEYKHNNNITIIQSSRRLTNERNINTLINDLVNADWKEIYDSDDINCMYNTFTEKITELYQSNCPVIYEKVKRKRPDKPWMTNGLKNACRKKNLLYKEFLKTRTNVSEDKYKKYKNKLTAILRRCEKQYFTELLEINKGNMKETWKILNGLINKKSKGKQISTEFNGDESKITGDKTIANGFNNFFVNIGPSLAKRIPKCKDSLFTQFLPDKIEDTMFLQPVTEEEIMQQVKNAKNKKSKDHDKFDMCLVKKIIPYIVKPLAHICNTSLMNGIFPDRMKIARVIPLFKNGDVKEFSNYRPVSILPQFSNILEKVFHNRLMSFINDKQILNNSQFGFRKNMSTALAIIELVEEITTAIDEGKTTVGVFIDLKKAFDTVNHNILVKKLEHYGIRGLAKDWVCSYLENRRQYVCINDSNSDCLDVKCGVPQGSILGPALFILYVNDMCNVSKSLKSILFADDTNLFYAGKDLDEVCKIVSRELNILHMV